MDLPQLFQRMLDLPDGLLYALLFAAALVENLLPPVPGDTVVVIGGYLAGLGRISVWIAYVLVTAGSWCGFMVYYGFGHWLGRTRAHELVGRWATPEVLRRGEVWVRRYGYWAVLANRMLTGARSVISITVGFARLRPGPVALLALASSALWNVLLVGGGFWVGEEWARLVALLRTYSRIVIVVTIVVAALLLLRYWRRRTRPGTGRA